jgi:hypothetical protein
MRKNTIPRAEAETGQPWSCQPMGRVALRALFLGLWGSVGLSASSVAQQCPYPPLSAFGYRYVACDSVHQSNISAITQCFRENGRKAREASERRTVAHNACLGRDALAASQEIANDTARGLLNGRRPRTIRDVARRVQQAREAIVDIHDNAFGEIDMRFSQLAQSITPPAHLSSGLPLPIQSHGQWAMLRTPPTQAELAAEQGRLGQAYAAAASAARAHAAAASTPPAASSNSSSSSGPSIAGAIFRGLLSTGAAVGAGMTGYSGSYTGSSRYSGPSRTTRHSDGSCNRTANGSTDLPC